MPRDIRERTECVSNDVSAVIRRVACGGAILMCLVGAPVRAQEPAAPCPCAEEPPPPPPPLWTGSLGAGLALTQGNRDTTNFNLSFDVKRDPKTRTVFKADALYILATENGNENVDRALANARVEYMLSERVFVFGQTSYVRDRFKEIDWLLAPTAGLGYKLVNTDRTSFDVDGSVGLVFEKNTGLDVETDGAFTFGERFAHKVSTNASITQGFAALWKMDDPGDALYAFSAGLSASITARTQLKLEFQDIYKTRPTGLLVDKNDIAFITAFVYKF
jgi:putative salt-induced outer membrane protein